MARVRSPARPVVRVRRAGFAAARSPGKSANANLIPVSGAPATSIALKDNIATQLYICVSMDAEEVTLLVGGCLGQREA